MKERKPKRLSESRFGIRADAEPIRRVTEQAERFGMSVSAYIRQAVVEKLERDERAATQADSPLT